MRRLFPLLLAILFLFSSCANGNGGEESRNGQRLPKPADPDDLFSYAFGYMFASSASSYGSAVSYDYLIQGIMDYSEGRQEFTKDEMNYILSSFLQQLDEERTKEKALAASKNLAEAESFLAANKGRRGVGTTVSGLQYEVLRIGSGRKASENDTVTINYQIVLLDGTIADSSYGRDIPSTISLSNTIPGFREAVSLMNEGAKYRFWIHPDIGFGSEEMDGIGPNSLLICDVELIEIEE